jgi:TolB-like protein/Tfp pilus assembly protein PilF
MVFTAILTQAPPSILQTRPDLPPALDAIIHKALEKDRALRYQSASDLRADLARLKHDLEPGTVGASSAATVIATPKGRILPLGAIAAAVLLAAAGGFLFWRTVLRPSAAQGIRSIAVLPLDDVSGDASEAYFSAGITDSLISTLSQIHDLKVVSRTTAMHYKGTKESVPEIGRELGVDAIVEGSVQRAAGHVRINAELIRAATDTHLWAQQYERDAADALKLEGEVAQSIAHEIRLQLTPEEIKRLAGRRISPEAREAFLRGRYFSWNFNDHDQVECVRNFEEAARLQPDFAAAYAGIALCWTARVNLGFLSPREAEGPARNAAAKAMELDPELPDSRDSRAVVAYTFEWDWDGAEKALRELVVQFPNYVDARNDYSYLLLITGRLPEAVAQMERAVALDPLNPGLRVTYGLTLARSRRYQEAEEQGRRGLELDPQGRIGPAILLGVAEQTKDPATVLKQLEDNLRPRGASVMNSALAGRLFVRMGRREDAQQIVANLLKPGARPAPIQMASLYLALGDKDQCFTWLRKGVEDHQGLLLKTDPLFDSVRSDPRFVDLLRRQHLQP